MLYNKRVGLGVVLVETGLGTVPRKEDPTERLQEGRVTGVIYEGRVQGML